jgi:hypothetical protein
MLSKLLFRVRFGRTLAQWKGLTAASYFKKYPPFGRIFPWQGEKCGLAR